MLSSETGYDTAKFKSALPVVVHSGEMIGRIGNNGSSSGPHLHIQVDRVKQEFLGDVLTLTQNVRAGKGVSFIRPLHFHRTFAMVESALKPGGVDANSNGSSMFVQGAYFENFGVIRK